MTEHQKDMQELKQLCELYEKIQFKVRCMDKDSDGYDTDEYYLRESLLPKPLNQQEVNTVYVKGTFKGDDRYNICVK